MNMYFTKEFIKRLKAEIKSCPNVYDEQHVYMLAQNLGITYDEAELAIEAFMEMFGPLNLKQTKKA